MIIFHIEDDNSELEAQLVDLLGKKGYFCTVGRCGQNSVVSATKLNATPSAPEETEASDETVASDADGLGSFEIADFGAQAIEIGKGISISSDSNCISGGSVKNGATAPEPEHHQTFPRPCKNKVIINEVSTLFGFDCVFDENCPNSVLYVQKIMPVENDPTRINVTISNKDVDCCINMLFDDMIISQCSNEKSLRTRELDGPVVKVTSPSLPSAFGLILRELSDNVTDAYCCIGQDLAVLANILDKDNEEATKYGEIPT